MIHHKNHHFLREPCSTKMPGTCLCHSFWLCEFTRYRKRVVNRLKVPQGLSTNVFRRWSEVPTRGGARGDSPFEKRPASQRCHIHVCVSFWQCKFTRNRKQVVNRPKIPQGLSTLMFHRWSEVLSRGGVRGDSL